MLLESPTHAVMPDSLSYDWKEGNGLAQKRVVLYPTEKMYGDIPLANVPIGWTPWLNKYGPQIEDPQALYPSAMLPGIDTIFAIKVTRDAVNSKFTVLASDVNTILLFSKGQTDLGTDLGIWWKLGLGDTTLQKDGAFVFSNNTFVAFGHTVSLEFMARRGGDGISETDPVVLDRLYQDGAGSYYEMLAQAVCMRVGLVFQWQGDQSPRFMGNLAFNGDASQMRGGAMISMSSATNGLARYIPWERQLLIGPRDSYVKTFGSLALSTNIDVPWIGENPPPEGNVYLFFRVRVYGGRKCGELSPGCPVMMK